MLPVKVHFDFSLVNIYINMWATARAPSNTEATIIVTSPLCSPKKEFHGTVLCWMSLHYPSDRVTRFCCAEDTIRYIQGISGSCGCRSFFIYFILRFNKRQQIFRPRIITDTSTSGKTYSREIKIYQLGEGWFRTYAGYGHGA